MNILQIIPQLTNGGAEQHVLDLCQYATHKGHTVFVASQGGKMIRQLNGVKFIKIPAHSKNPLTMIANIFRLLKIIRTQKIDIIHAHSRAPAWSAFFACKPARCKFITTYHGAYRQNNFLKKFYNSIMIKSDLTIANSKWTEQFIKKEYNIKNKIKLIPIGIDCEKFNPANISLVRQNNLRKKWNIKKNNFIILHLARLSKIKGQKITIKAAQKIVAKNNNAIFILAGTSHKKNNYKHQLQNLIKKYNLKKNVKLTGQCNDPAAALSICNIALSISTQEETLGLATLEALAMEKNVIATNIGASHQLLGAGRGALIAANNPQQLTTKIQDIMKEKTHKNKQNTRKFVIDNFDKNNACKKIIKLYKNLKIPC